MSDQMTKQRRRGFHFALEPVRAKAEWHLSDLRLSLAAANTELAEAKQVLEAIEAMMARARAERLRRLAENAALSIATERLEGAYYSQLQRRHQTQQDLVTGLEHDRDQVAEQLAHAQRYLDGLEDCLDEALREFDQAAAATRYREADDHVIQRFSSKETA